MNTRTSVVTPALPRVNLLPSEIAEARRLRRIQLGMGGAVAVAVLAVGGLWFMEHHAVSAAQASVDAANSENTSLQQQIGKYGDVTQTKNLVTAMQAQLNQATAHEVQFSHFMNALSLVLPDNAWMTQLTLTIGNGTGSGTTAAATVTPGATAAGAEQPVGSLVMAGQALNHDGVADVLRMLAKQHGVQNPYFSTSTETLVQNSTKRIESFNVTADLDNDIFVTNPAPKAGG